MGRKLKINWQQLSKIGNDTADLVVNLEKARLRIKIAIDSMDEAWTGADAINFKNSYYSLLDDLSSEITMLLQWSEYFQRASKKYSSAQEQINRDVDKLKLDLESMCRTLISEEDRQRR